MQESIQDFVDAVVLSVSRLESTLGLYVEKDTKAFDKAVGEVSSAEQDADEIRRRLEASIFKFGLLPYSRMDYISLLESSDDIADKAEMCAKLLKVYKPKLSRNIAVSVTKLMHETLATVEVCKECVLALEFNLDLARQKADETERRREVVRELEFKALELIFSEKSADLAKFTLQQIVSIIGSIADKAEEVSDFVSALSVKYQS